MADCKYPKKVIQKVTPEVVVPNQLFQTRATNAPTVELISSRSQPKPWNQPSWDLPQFVRA
jgi:hypothetical protein